MLLAVSQTAPPIHELPKLYELHVPSRSSQLPGPDFETKPIDSARIPGLVASDLRRGCFALCRSVRRLRGVAAAAREGGMAFLSTDI